MTVVARFAPSPTGFLHIGGARTALFNWLYARGRGGKMLLRIEDTDRERSTQAAIDAILDGLKWLGITWDGDTVYQFARSQRHREVVEQLLAAGRAYRCYASPEELAEMREAARREGRAKLYDGRWRDRDPAEAPPGVKPVIRLKAPTEGETIIEDQAQGRVVWQNQDLDDLVLLRSDQTPTYMIAAFELAQIGRSPARFDFAKLENLNGHYMRQTPDAELLAEIERVLPHIAGGEELAAKLSPELRQKLLDAMPGLKERAKTLVELVDSARYLHAERPIKLEDKAAALLTPDARAMIAGLLPVLESLDPWTQEHLEQAVRGFAEQR